MKDGNDYMTPGDVARVLHVSPKTVVRWAACGFIPYILTLGGHRRFQRADVEALAARMTFGPQKGSEG